MEAPTRADYVRYYSTLFERFEQAHPPAPHRGRPFTYAQRLMIVFFPVMLLRRIVEFKAQQRWVSTHPDDAEQLGFSAIPHRTTLMRRYKALAPTIDAFVTFVGEWAETIDEACSSEVLVVDGSLFKARGPVWHQSDREQGRVPDKLRNLDQEASWGKSGYHGWVYGYRLHFTCHLAGFPKAVQVTTGSTAESTVLEQHEREVLARKPKAVVGDNGFCKATRIRRWAKEGVMLVTPASKWRQGRYAQAYHRFLKQGEVAAWLKARRTAIEPLFDLLRQVLGTKGLQKQLPVAGEGCVGTFLGLGVLAVQMAMLVNSVWGYGFREVSHILAAFS
jgi:Transposase DDE domain